MATRDLTGLEGELEALLGVERFDPPGEFAERALLADPAVYDEAAADPEAWWLRQARELLDWDSEPSEALDESNPPFFKWFADGELNVSANCLDRHVAAGLGDRVAYHWRGEEGEERDLTYAGLLADTQRFANALRDHGVGKGDVVGIYLPMIPQVVVAMLACARIGAIHSIVFGGFSPESLASTGRGARARRRRSRRASTRSWPASARSRRSSSSGTRARRARCRRAATSGSRPRWRRPPPSARPSR
jgi:acetyl-CoA synthetase